MNENDFKVKCFKDSKGTIRREISKMRMSKKERLRKRREEKEKFPETGRGNVDEKKLNKVKQFLRDHSDGVTAIQVANYAGVTQARAARLLDLLSGGQENESGQDFLIYMDDEENPPLYFISKDKDVEK
jgi:response regulator of citrate/malate metabolism